MKKKKEYKEVKLAKDLKLYYYLNEPNTMYIARLTKEGIWEEIKLWSDDIKKLKKQILKKK